MNHYGSPGGETGSGARNSRRYTWEVDYSRDCMKPKHRALSALLVLFICIVPADHTAQAQQLVTTSDPPSGAFYFGTDAFTHYAAGQTFVSLGNQLLSFGFYAFGPWTVLGSFQAQIFAWNGSAVTGSALYASSPFAPVTSSGWIDFSAGGVGLNSGSSYLALISMATNTTPAGCPNCYWNLGRDLQNPYAGGHDVFTTFLTSPPSLSDVQTAVWNTLTQAAPGNDQDFAFRATFTTVTPEPGSIVLLATGLVGIGLVMRRRRRRALR